VLLIPYQFNSGLSLGLLLPIRAEILIYMPLTDCLLRLIWRLEPHVKHNPNGETRKRELLDKLNKKTLTPDEATELKGILDRELAEARQRGDTATILVILLLLGLIAAIIYAASRS
jgi:hypothetical protein